MSLGHEIVGRVSDVGSGVTKFKVGDMMGVGCFVDSCNRCKPCQDGMEQYCENELTPTYNSEDLIGGTPHKFTMGGYADIITVKERFVLRMPENIDFAAASPLLCAGITVYSPLRHWNIGKGQKVGVIGL
ncbi:alcohol dehydrogenase catalytic domain-containing protein [Candidatus Liberibacter solanacearum]|uniref:alcohol dehydrogenase catalytic domain-containing protein n=1 Tax=Candidatus Liberibacter solanacearum TaxID=556287 RepID=UPI00387DC4DA